MTDEKKANCHPDEPAAKGGFCLDCWFELQDRYNRGKLKGPMLDWYERVYTEPEPSKPEPQKVYRPRPWKPLARFSVESDLPGHSAAADPLAPVQVVVQPAPKPGSTKGVFLAWVNQTYPTGQTRMQHFWHDCSWGIPTASKTGFYVCAHGFTSDGTKQKAPP